MTIPTALRAALVTSLLLMLPASSKANQDQTVSVRATASDTLTLGEPVQATLTVVNGLRERVFVDLGADFIGNLALTVTHPDGSRATSSIPASGGFRAIGRVSIAAGERYTRDILLNDWVSFSRPGTYRVSIQPTVRAVTASWRPVELPAAEVRIAIAQRDDVALRSACERLATIVLTSEDPAGRIAAARAIAVIEDPVVVPFIDRVMHASDKSDWILIPALARIANQDALTVLEAAAASSNRERSALARDALESHRTGIPKTMSIDALR
jgi:hypothetical protein